MNQDQIMKLVHAFADVVCDYVASDYVSASHTADLQARAEDARAAVVAAIEQLTKDAARYRWLRHGDNDEFVIKETPLGNPYISRNELLDAQIDAAIAAQKEQIK